MRTFTRKTGRPSWHLLPDSLVGLPIDAVRHWGRRAIDEMAALKSEKSEPLDDMVVVGRVRLPRIQLILAVLELVAEAIGPADPVLLAYAEEAAQREIVAVGA